MEWSPCYLVNKLPLPVMNALIYYGEQSVIAVQILYRKSAGELNHAIYIAAFLYYFLPAFLDILSVRSQKGQETAVYLRRGKGQSQTLTGGIVKNKGSSNDKAAANTNIKSRNGNNLNQHEALQHLFLKKAQK